MRTNFLQIAQCTFEMSSLSVILSNYNHAAYLDRSLTAITSQRRVPEELIIIDDASTDSSRQIITDLAARFSFVVPIINPTNRGAIANANDGLLAANGDYVFFAAADDEILPGFIEHSMERAVDGAGVICSDPVWFDEATGWQRRTRLLGKAPLRLTPVELLQRMRKRPFALPGHSSLVKRTAAVEAGGLVPELRWHCDWFMNHVVAFRLGLSYIPSPLSRMRLRAGSYSAPQTRDDIAESQVLARLVELLDSPAYKDVRAAFVDSGVLVTLSPDLLKYARQLRKLDLLLTPRARSLLRIESARAQLLDRTPRRLKDSVKRLSLGHSRSAVAAPSSSKTGRTHG